MIFGLFGSLLSWTKDLKTSINANLDAYNLLSNANTKDTAEKVEAALIQKGYNKELATTATISAMESKQKNKNIALTKAEIITTTALTKAQKALNVVKKAGAFIAGNLAVAIASYAITGVVQKIYENAKAQKELAENTRNAAEEYNNSVKSIDEYTSKYEDLHKALVEAKGDEEETYNIKKQLYDLQTNLNETYGDEVSYVDFVTGSYETQLEVLRQLNIEKAKTFQEDNAEGIEDANKAMTANKTYQLGFNVNNGTEAAERILEIVESFENINLTGLNDIEITTTTNAYDTKKEIESFKTQISNLKKEFGNTPIIDSVIGWTQTALDKIDETIKEHGETYSTNLEADTTIKDHLYNKKTIAENTVKDFNKALSESSNIFDDDKVDAAYQKMIKYEEHLRSEKAWENYGAVIDNIFDKANDASYEFGKGIVDRNSELNGMAKELKGMTDTEFEAIAHNSENYAEAIRTGSEEAIAEIQKIEVPENKDAIDSIVAWGEQYGLTIEQIANLLVDLGYLQSEVLNPEPPAPPNTTRQMIGQINALSDGFEQLDKIMASIKDEDPFDYTLLDDKALEEFEIAGEAYDEFIKTVSANPKDLEKCQDAFNNLATEWVDKKFALEGLSDETVELTANMLKNMGVTNAAEVVEQAYARQKAKIAWETRESTNAIVDEIESLVDENGTLDDSEKAWAGYIAQKMLDEVYNGNGDIYQLKGVLQALGLGVKGWQAYATAKAKAMYSPGDLSYALVDEGTDGMSFEKVDAENSREYWEKTAKSIYEELNQQIESLILGFDYDGGTKTNDTGSSKDPKEEEIDWIERKKEILQRLHDVQEEIANNEMESYQERVDALDYLIEKDKERVEVAKNAVSQYEKAWLDASKNLSKEDKDFIKFGGDIIKKYNAQELLDAGIVDSLEAGEEYIENLKLAQDCYDKMIESQKEELAHQKESIEHQKQKIQLLRDQIAAQQDLNNAMTDQINSQKELSEVQGKYIGQAYYEDLISQSKERKSLIQEDIDRLYEQLDLTEEESAERDNILVEIENCKNELIQCEVEQAELNDTIMRLPIERLQMFRDLYAQIIEDMGNYRSIQEKLGLNPTKEELQEYIDLYSESINDTIKQQNQLKDLLKNYSYGSDKFNETSEEIQSLDNEISNLIANQIELNYQMLQIPITEMSEEIDKLGTYKEALNNAIAEDNANGLQTTVEQYRDLHSITLQQLGLYAQQKAELTKLLGVYDEESEYYKETEQQIADIDSNISSLVQETYQWNQELLNIPIENLEKVNENLSSYSSILDGIISEYDSALSGINTLIDNEIEGVQDVLDALNQQNEALQIQRNLEQALYNLRRAEEQKNVAVIRNGKKVWESNSDDLRSANQEHQDALLEKQKYELELQIEHLEEIKEKWQDIIDKIQEAKDLQAAEDLFGDGWQDSVLADSADLRDMYQALYESTSKEKEAVDKQIESNERISQMMNEFVARYQEGSLTYEEALNGINSLISSMEGGFSAFEQLNGMMNLDNIASLGDIASSAEAGITGSAELLEKYLGIVESNKTDVEKFETDWNAASKGVEGIIDSFNVAVESMDGYIDAFNKNAEAISANTNTWTEMKELIEEQVEALKKAAEELEKSQKNTSSSKPSSGSSNDDDDTSENAIGVYHHEYGYLYKYGDNGTLVDPETGKDLGVKNYKEFMEVYGDDLKKKNTYHKGILKGPVGFTPLSNDSIYQFAKRIATNPLKADEVAAILQKGEFVTQPEQMSNIMRNNQMIGQMAAEQATNAIGRASTNAQAFSFSIGEIHLHEVQNVDEFAKALNQTFASSMQQNFSKIFKN